LFGRQFADIVDLDAVQQLTQHLVKRERHFAHVLERVSFGVVSHSSDCFHKHFHWVSVANELLSGKANGLASLIEGVGRDKKVTKLLPILVCHLRHRLVLTFAMRVRADVIRRQRSIEPAVVTMKMTYAWLKVSRVLLLTSCEVVTTQLCHGHSFSVSSAGIYNGCCGLPSAFCLRQKSCTPSLWACLMNNATTSFAAFPPHATTTLPALRRTWVA